LVSLNVIIFVTVIPIILFGINRLQKLEKSLMIFRKSNLLYLRDVSSAPFDSLGD